MECLIFFFSPPSSWCSKGYQGRRQIPALGGCFVVAAQPFQWNGGSLSHLLKVKWETCKCISSCVSATKVVSRRDSGHAIGAGFESAIIHSVGKSLKNFTHRICQVSNNATHFDSFSNSVNHCKVLGEFLHQVKKKLSVFRATGLVSLILRSEGSSFTLTVRPPPSWCPGDRPPPALMVSMLPSGNSSPFCEKSIFTLRSSRRGAELRRLNILEKPIKGFTMLSISKLLVL